MEKVRIAVEDWGLYNNGILVCKWWDSDSNIEDIEEYYKNIRKENNIYPSYEVELFSADWENDFLDICSENCNISEVLETYESLSFDDEEIEKIQFLRSEGYSYKEALEKLEDTQVYDVNSMEKLAEIFVNKGLYGKIPANLINHIDYKSIGRDLSHDYTKFNNKIYIAS